MDQSKYILEIVLKEGLDNRWADWFAGFRMAPSPEGATCLNGEVSDQAALHGVLERIRDLNLNLVSLQVTERNKKG